MRPCLVAAAVLSPTSAVAQVTVDQMTCAQAQTFVHQNGRVYAKSLDGPLPVYPISSVWKIPYCPTPSLLWHQTYVTRDGVHCTVGYMCYESGNVDLGRIGGSRDDVRPNTTSQLRPSCRRCHCQRPAQVRSWLVVFGRTSSRDPPIRP